MFYLTMHTVYLLFKVIWRRLKFKGAPFRDVLQYRVNPCQVGASP